MGDTEEVDALPVLAEEPTVIASRSGALPVEAGRAVVPAVQAAAVAAGGFVAGGGGGGGAGGRSRAPPPAHGAREGPPCQAPESGPPPPARQPLREQGRRTLADRR